MGQWVLQHWPIGHRAVGRSHAQVKKLVLGFVSRYVKDLRVKKFRAFYDMQKLVVRYLCLYFFHGTS